jgi:hypothetical protein
LRPRQPVQHTLHAVLSHTLLSHERIEP